MFLRALFLIAGLLAVCTTAHASRSTYNPMAPRVLYEKAQERDTSYGLSILPGNAIDGTEGLNRAMWFVNYDIFDMYVLRPVAHGYAALPQFVQDGTGNFFSNITELNSTINNLFVGRFTDSAISLARFTINTTFGILGLMDVATRTGIEQRSMDMTTVLGKGDMDQGSYLMVPIYGPTTTRSAQGSAVDATPYYFVNFWISAVCYVIRGVHARAQLIDQEGLIDNAIDPYAQTRDIYLMYQEGKVNEGAATAPASDTEEEFDESILEEIDG